MNAFARLFRSSLGKKYLMAVSGLILAGFVLGHMAGNLQIFGDPYYINAYAHKLQTLPYGLLWVERAVMLLAVIVHAWTGISLWKENKKARPETYRKDATVQASKASRTMAMSGIIILAFIIFHIAHYTVREVPGHYYDESIVMPDGTEYPAEVPLVKHGKPLLEKTGEPLMVHDVHTMMVAGFSYWWISLFYVIAVGLLCLHLSHGFGSMFQSMGWRNENVRRTVELIGVVYGFVVFIGFAIVPVAVLFGAIEPTPTVLPEGVQHLLGH